MLGFVRGLESTGEKDDLAIALVAFQGLAIGMLKADSPVAKGVSDAAARGVEIVACEYSMTVRNVTSANEQERRQVCAFRRDGDH